MTETKLTSQELFDTLHPNMQWSQTAQLLSNGLSINMSDFYTQLIRDAARCNDYSSDVIFDINYINQRLEDYHGGYFEPIWIAFRKHGVDGTNYILCRTNEYETPFACINREYFVVYSVSLAETDYEGFYDVVFSKYLT